ncbi:Tar ligand binding domain-containing protein, partial [Citrobacter freundii]|uniref:Tar ligand binding domain-containing protein n=1 Tax=Citrobacter freundii TaxID=546 RepID=UPI00292ABF8B
MFNRIRVVTMLMMVLGVFALLQLVSGGLLFSSLQQNQQSFVISNDLRQQQSELTSTWDLMLQTRINLSRSSARMMMDASNCLDSWDHVPMRSWPLFKARHVLRTL